MVSPGYFETLGEGIGAGRGFSASDTAASLPVVLVNRAFAKAHLGGAQALGRQIRLRLRGSWGRWRTIVGITPDFVAAGDGREAAQQIFVPLAQSPPSWLTVLMRRGGGGGGGGGGGDRGGGANRRGGTNRSGGDAAVLAHDLARAVGHLDPEVPVFWVRTLAERRDDLISESRSLAETFSTFGAAAFGAALLGVFGAATMTLLQRRREAGIRFALGAGRGVVAALLLRGLAIEAAAGLLLGSGLALYAWPVFAHLVPGAAVLRPGLVGLVLGAEAAGVGLVCAVPTLRIALARPFEVLKAG